MKTVNDLVEELRKYAEVDGKLWLTDDDKKEPAEGRILVYKNQESKKYQMPFIELNLTFNDYFLNRGHGKYNLHIFETKYLSQETKEQVKQCLRIINKYLEEII
jgi:hypothetical protein